MKRPYLLALIIVVLSSGETKAQTAPGLVDAAAITQVFVRSQKLKQGDAESLKQAEAQFTTDGLTQFIKKMDGFIDDKGASTFTQEFVPIGDAVIVGKENGSITAHISGELKQIHNASTTTYPGTFVVIAAGTPLKIVRFSLLISASK